MNTRYIEVRFICPADGKEQVAIINGLDMTTEQIREAKQESMDALGCGGRHTILSVGEVDSAHAALTTKKQIDANEEEYYRSFDDEEDDYEPQYDDEPEYYDAWDDDPWLPYGDEDGDY